MLSCILCLTKAQKSRSFLSCTALENTRRSPHFASRCKKILRHGASYKSFVMLSLVCNIKMRSVRYVHPQPFQAEKTHTHQFSAHTMRSRNNYSSSGHFNDDLLSRAAAAVAAGERERKSTTRTYNLFSSHFITKDKRLLPVLTHSAAQPLTRFAREQRARFFDAAYAFLRRAYILFTSSRLKNNYAPTVVAPHDWISHFCDVCGAAINSLSRCCTGE